MKVQKKNNRRIADLIPSHDEGQLMTQSGNREFLGLDRLGLFGPPNSGLEIIRNQTLPGVITE